MSDQDLEKQALALLAEAKTIQIADDLQYATTGLFLTRCAEERKARKAFFEPDIAKANALHKSLTAKLRQALEPIENAEAVANRLRTEYRARKEQEAALELAKANAAAQKAADDLKLSAAVGLEQEGKRQEAEDVLSAPLAAVPVAAAASAPPKTDGLVLRGSWVVEAIDREALPKIYMVPNEKKIGGVVKSMGKDHNIPGVSVRWVEKEFGRKQRVAE